MKKTAVIVSLIVVFVLLTILAIFFFMFPIKYEDLVKKYSEKYNLDTAFVLSIINVESSFDKTAKSRAGALGLMQLLPSTATEIAQKLGMDDFAVDMLYEPEINISFGCYYMRYLLDMFNGDRNKAVCAYNAGYNNVMNWQDENGNLLEIPFAETKSYLRKINLNYKVYKYIF